MSNPAVLQLASTYIGSTEIRIEDNWAESIHLHIGMMRIDLTVEEFLEIADKMGEAANQLINAENFDVNDFDPLFLSYYHYTLTDLESVSKDTIRLGDITILKNKKLPCYRTIEKSRNYKALNGDTEELDSYTAQINMIGQNNMQRLHSVLDCIKQNGYPYNNEYIVLRNDQAVLMDGQHRAACLLHLYGPDVEIPVLRFNFKNKKYNITDWHPWRRALYKKVIRFFKRIGKKLLGSDKAIDS